MADTFIIGDYTYTIQDRYVTIGTTSFQCVTAKARQKQVSYGSLTNNDIIIDGVTIPIVSYNSTNYILSSISRCFESCSRLVTAPTIPRTVVNFSYAFNGCTLLTSVTLPTDTLIPEAYRFGRSLSSAFVDCVSLVTPPNIPSYIEDMDYCFYGCTSLQSAPDLSNTDVRKMTYCFKGCTSLLTPPILPQNPNLIHLQSCFEGCSKLQSAPIFYNDESNTTTFISRCYYGCSSLSGDVYLPNRISSASSVTGVFGNTGDIPNRIYVHTQSEFVDDIVATSGGTAVAGSTNVNICNTRRLTDAENTSFGTTNGVRIDMLLDGHSAGIINGISRSDITLYEVATDTQITFPTTLGSVMVYAIVNNVANVPNVSISFYFNTYNYSNPIINVSAPCTAQPCDIVRDGEVNPICAHGITTNNIIMNEVLTGSTNVYDILVELYKKIYPSQYETLVQSFNKSKTSRIQQYDNGVDNTKHINTTADSVMVTSNMNLQEVITNLYNEIDS